MPESASSDVLRLLQGACALQGTTNLSDHELLDRFLANRDDAAFTFLVRRHGPVLFSVCQRLLGDRHHAEDALQAAFLVLVRRPGSIKRKQSVGSWLYGVAQRIALKTRARDAARRNREREAGSTRVGGSLDEPATRELRSVLDEAIGSLPEKYRGPIILCYLEGKTHEQPGNLAIRGLDDQNGEGGGAGGHGKNAVGGCISAHVLALTEEAIRGLLWVKAKTVLVVPAQEAQDDTWCPSHPESALPKHLGKYQALGGSALVWPLRSCFNCSEISTKLALTWRSVARRDARIRRTAHRANSDKTATEKAIRSVPF